MEWHLSEVSYHGNGCHWIHLRRRVGSVGGAFSAVCLMAVVAVYCLLLKYLRLLATQMARSLQMSVSPVVNEAVSSLTIKHSCFYWYFACNPVPMSERYEGQQSPLWFCVVCRIHNLVGNYCWTVYKNCYTNVLLDYVS